MKQKTLEEVAKKYAESNQYDLTYHDEGGYQGIDQVKFSEKLVDFTTNWQEHRMYSEEEVRDIIDKTIEKFYKHNYNLTKSELKKAWFEQFKKK